MIRNLVLCAAVVSAWFSPASARPSNDELKVMSFNIRIDTKADGPNQWSNRRDFAANMIRFYDIDIFGAQEVFANQMTDLQERLPEYGSIGIGLEDGKSKGQHDPIFWKKERFELLDHGFFWFAEDINAIGQRAWDAASPRMGSWAILKDKISKRKLFFMNVHIDHIGQVARRESAKLILDRLGALAGDLPVIRHRRFQRRTRFRTDPDPARSGQPRTPDPYAFRRTGSLRTRMVLPQLRPPG